MEIDLTQDLKGYPWVQNAEQTGGEEDKEIIKEAVAVIQISIGCGWTGWVDVEVGETLGFWICF